MLLRASGLLRVGARGHPRPIPGVASPSEWSCDRDHLAALALQPQLAPRPAPRDLPHLWVGADADRAGVVAACRLRRTGWPWSPEDSDSSAVADTSRKIHGAKIVRTALHGAAPV